MDTSTVIGTGKAEFNAPLALLKTLLPKILNGEIREQADNQANRTENSHYTAKIREFFDAQ